MGGTPKTEFRLNEQLVNELDAYARHLAEQTGRRQTRTSAIRVLLREALDAHRVSAASAAGSSSAPPSRRTPLPGPLGEVLDRPGPLDVDAARRAIWRR